MTMLNATIERALSPYIQPVQPVAKPHVVGKRITSPYYRNLQVNLDTASDMLEMFDDRISALETELSELREMKRTFRGLVGAK